MQNRLKNLFLVTSFTLFSSGTFANKNLIEQKENSSFENIKVEKLASNKHASDFLIHIKNKVPAHYHQSHTEIVYVIEGTADMTLDGKTFNVEEGDYIRILPGQVHSVVVTSNQPLKVLSIQTPEFDGSDRVMVKQE